MFRWRREARKCIRTLIRLMEEKPSDFSFIGHPETETTYAHYEIRGHGIGILLDTDDKVLEVSRDIDGEFTYPVKMGCLLRHRFQRFIWKWMTQRIHEILLVTDELPGPDESVEQKSE